ncbi:glycosyl transferase [Mangrovactinospora gilvigrisea]|uniref:Glycosyl transferase n=1 Tax=Mangrovactinospora gilvigrisea TaxID=1428644 RepID=A0A1J7CDJ4_9ACTN|nr:glycosyltransferase family 2 protein [Mangrovactinospora gilvigrisea]OIV37730.1 glycosyl transferase [Mangrovactinospora gilvigrisea]
MPTATTTLPAPAPAPAPERPRTVLVLVPAHNEQDVIGRCLDALRAQTARDDPSTALRLTVVADNCTDATPELARAHGARVFETIGNRHKKAGGLNQALAALLPELGDDDAVLVTDADCALDPDFVRNALTRVDEGYGGVGGVFRGDPGGGFVGHLQRNEYARYARDVSRLRGKCLVITGTAAMFPVRVLREVSAARLAGELPAGDGRGGVYDTTVLTEDNELTFALKHRGHEVISPADCTLATEVMPDWRSLWRQRLRWKRGAVENCFQYGLTRVTWRYWGRQLLTLAGVVVTVMYLGSIVWAVAVAGGLVIAPFWLGVTGVFVVERVVTVRLRGWRQMLLAASMYELVLDFFLQACHGKAYADALLRRKKNW